MAYAQLLLLLGRETETALARHLQVSAFRLGSVTDPGRRAGIFVSDLLDELDDLDDLYGLYGASGDRLGADRKECRDDVTKLIQ